MAADYNLPSELLFSNVKLTQEIPTFTSEALNLKKTSVDRGLHRLSGTIDVTIPELENQRAYIGFLAKCKGQSGTFELDLPLHFKSTDSSNPVAATAIDTGDVEITLSAFTGIIRAGTMFNVPNDNKTYVVTDDTYSGGTLKFFPAMNRSHLVNTILEVRNPVIVASFTTDNQSVSMDEHGQIITTTIEWQERL